MKEHQKEISLIDFNHADILAAYPEMKAIKEELSILRKYSEGKISITEFHEYLQNKGVSEGDINRIIKILAD